MPGSVSCSSVLSGVSLIHKSQFDMLSGYLLHLPRQFAYLGAVLFISGRNMQRQQMAQRVNHRVGLQALAPIGPVVAGTRSRLRRRLQRAAIDDHGRGLRGTSGKLAQQQAQILDHHLETARVYPAPSAAAD